MIWSTENTKTQENQQSTILSSKMKEILWFREYMRTHRKSWWMCMYYWELSSAGRFSDQKNESKSIKTFIWSDNMFKRNSFKEDMIAVLEALQASSASSFSIF